VMTRAMRAPRIARTNTRRVYSTSGSSGIFWIVTARYTSRACCAGHFHFAAILPS
jgi:hypothetical protein